MAGENALTGALHGIDTLIARGCRIDGHLVFRGGLRVDGQVSGDVSSETDDGGYMLITRSGQIRGEIRAGHVVIDGQVVGNLLVAGRVELLARARIIGDIHYVSLGMKPGATVIGQLYPEYEAPTHRQPSAGTLLKLA